MDYSKLKFALYARKSNEDDGKQVQSIPDQIKLMKERAQSLGIKVTNNDVYQEAKSAKAPGTRDEFDRLVGDIKQGKKNAVLCWQLNRLSRNPTESGLLQQLLQDETLLCIQTHDRTYLPEDNALVFSVEAGMNNQFIRDLMKNVRRGMHSKAEKGWLPGRPAIGYTNDRERGTIVADPDRFNQVRRMWDMLLSGTYTVSQIARIADKEWGLVTIPRRKSGGKPLTVSGVYALFQNPFYAGWVVYGGKSNPEGKHPPMITQAEFDSAQKIIKRRSTPRANVEQEVDPFPYRGLIQCGECGCAVTYTRKVKKYKNGTEQVFEYCYCTKRRQGCNCEQLKRLKPKEITAQVEKELKKYTIMPDFFEWACKYLSEYNDSEIEKQDAVYLTQIKAIESTENEIRELGRMRYRGQCDDGFYEAEKYNLEQKLLGLRKQFNEQQDNNKNWRLRADRFFNFARYAEEDFASDNNQLKRNVLAELGENLKLTDGKIECATIKYLVPVIEAKQNLMAEYVRVMTQPQQMKKASMEALISNWYTRRDSNARPSVPQTDALSS